MSVLLLGALHCYRLRGKVERMFEQIRSRHDLFRAHLEADILHDGTLTYC